MLLKKNPDSIFYTEYLIYAKGKRLHPKERVSFPHWQNRPKWKLQRSQLIQRIKRMK